MSADDETNTAPDVLLRSLRLDDHVAQLLVTPKPLTDSQRKQLKPHATDELVTNLLELYPRNAPHAEFWFRMCARIALVQPAVLGNEKVRDKMTDLAVLFKSEPKVVHWFSVAVNNITAAPPATPDAISPRQLFCTETTRATFCTLARALSHVNSEHISKDIRNPIEAEKAIKAFNDSLSLSVTWLARAIASTTHIDPKTGETLYAHESIRDALIMLMIHPAAMNPDSIFWICASLSNVTRVNDPTKETCFGTAELRDALIGAQKFASTPESTQTWCGAIANITTCNDADARKRFATDEMRLALVDAAANATSSTALTLWCSALNNLTMNNVALKKKYATLNIREALQLLALNADTVEVARWWCWAVYSIVVVAPADPEVRKLFASGPMRDALVLVASVYAKEDECAANVWLDCVEKLTCPVNEPKEGEAEGNSNEIKSQPSGALGSSSSQSTSAVFKSEQTMVNMEHLPEADFCNKDLVEAMLDVLDLVHVRGLPKWKRTMCRIRKVAGHAAFDEKAFNARPNAFSAATSSTFSGLPTPQKGAGGKGSNSKAATLVDVDDDALMVADSIVLSGAPSAPPQKRAAAAAAAADPDLLLGAEESLVLPPRHDHEADDDIDLSPGEFVKEASL